ncbi:MAG: hypothetical protein HQ561_01020 [Desulfobacteraceae bacterium]|nr:hypothetical protein [Desulfobacteraceae bacterium]
MPDNSAGLSHERFKVRFSFRTKEVVEFKYGQVGGTRNFSQVEGSQGNDVAISPGTWL